MLDTASQLTAPNRTVHAANGVTYAYRRLGAPMSHMPPLVLLQHYRGNLDNWDPALIDALAAGRRIVAFDNAGVGGSTGTTPHAIGQMAHDAIAFLTAMGLFIGQSTGFFAYMKQLAQDADSATRGV